jgi:hypothetical protein
MKALQNNTVRETLVEKYAQASTASPAPNTSAPPS